RERETCARVAGHSVAVALEILYGVVAISELGVCKSEPSPRACSVRVQLFCDLVLGQGGRILVRAEEVIATLEVFVCSARTSDYHAGDYSQRQRKRTSQRRAHRHS